jgi:hypothetical protein
MPETSGVRCHKYGVDSSKIGKTANVLAGQDGGRWR